MNIINNEECKVIQGFPNYAIYKDGRVQNIKSGRFLRFIVNNNGYFRIHLNFNGKQNTKLVHRLIAEHFILNPNNYPFVDHIDNNRQNNDISNLRWITRSGNTRNCIRSKKSGLPRGVKTSGKKYRADIHIENKCVYLGTFVTVEEASKAYEEKYNELMSIF